MPAPLFIMFFSLLGYAAVAWYMAGHELSKRMRALLLPIPLVPGLWGAISLGAALQTPSKSELSPLLITGSSLIAAVAMLFCAALIAVFTCLLQRSRKREQLMSGMAAELRFEEAQLHLLVASVSGVLWQRSPQDWHYLSLSPQADGFLGYKEWEWLSDAAFFRERVHPKDLAGVQTAWRSSAAEVKRYQVEFRFQKKDGTYAMLCEDGVTLPDATGRLTTCGVMKDISERHAQAEMQNRLHKQQVEAAHEAGKSEIAKSVLHNIGNVLTSLNVSAKLHVEKLAGSRSANLGKAARMLRENEADLATFLREHPQGRRLPGYLITLSDHLAEESRQLYLDAMSMVQHIEHMKDVISLQQLHGRASQVDAAVDLASLLEQSLALEGDVLRDRDIHIERHFADMPPLMLPKNLMLQVLVNLVSNARHAVSAAGVKERRIMLYISQPQPGSVMIAVQDTGCGISRPNLQRIFTHGFTTRKEGNGFGLHHAALLVEEMGGTLKALSDGEGLGASFVLEFPARFAPQALAAASRSHASGPLPSLKKSPASTAT
jgi:signal transduction histidine kinase